MNVTITDVANAAGVSIATVSNVLNETCKVSEEARQSVLSAVKGLGYVPNAHARQLASHNARAMGIIIPDIENPFFPEVIKTFEERVRKLGYNAIIGNASYDRAGMRAAAARMVEHNVRGVAIMTSEVSLQLVSQLTRNNIAVQLSECSLARNYMTNLRIDYHHGLEQLIEHLYDLGHRSIAFVAGRPGSESTDLLLKAYENLMNTFGLMHGTVLPGNLRFEGGLAASVAIVKICPRPTAVIAINDLTALGVIKGLLKKGFRVPQDISVTGFGNTRFAEYSNPSITTVDIHRNVLGHIAADALHELSTSTNPPRTEYRIHASLVVRDSSGPLSTEFESRG